MQERMTNYQHRYRYINTGVLLITALFNSLSGSALSTISNEVTMYFPDVSTPEVSACALVVMLIHLFNPFLANYVLDSYSIKLGITINCVVVIVGMALRTLISVSFFWVIFGNAVVALGNIFIFCVPAKFSALWFLPSNRLLVTSILQFTTSISGPLGSAISPIFVHSNLTPEEGRAQIIRYIWIETAAVCSCMLLNIVFFRGEPTATPCFQKKSLDSDKTPYKDKIKKLLKTKDYIFILIAMACTYSIMNSFAVNVQIFLIPFHRDSKDASILVGLATISGISGLLVISKFLKRSQKYKKTFIFLYTMAGLWIFLFFVGLIWEIGFLLWISVCMFAFFQFPLIPGLIQYACQRMYPIGEATVMGILLTAGEFGSFLDVQGSVQSLLLQNKTKQGVYYSFLIYFVQIFFSLVLLYNTKEQLNRICPKESLLPSTEQNDIISS